MTHDETQGNWYIYLCLVDFYGKCGKILTSGGAFDSVGEVHGSTCSLEMDSSKMFKLLLMEEILHQLIW